MVSRGVMIRPMDGDLEERFAGRFPNFSQKFIARLLAQPESSPARRNLLRRAFRVHAGTAHPSGGVYRTPDERFEGLDGYDFEPNYRTVGDLRLHHIDVGEGPPVLMVHGSPTWSFVWRRVIPAIREAGYRCVAPDNAGFGRSDKPIDPGWQSLERHVELTCSLIDELDLRDVTLVVHDWGGPIGMTVGMVYPERISRIVVLDTILDPNEVWVNETWTRVRDWIEETEDFSIGELARAASLSGMPESAVAGYEAPFPVGPSKSGPRGLTLSTPRPGDTGMEAFSAAAIAAYRRDTRPMLALWAEYDMFLTVASGQRLMRQLGRDIDHVIPGAGHVLQEDQGELVGSLIAEWLSGS
jgi:haloalkane dehalogenase